MSTFFCRVLNTNGELFFIIVLLPTAHNATKRCVVSTDFSIVQFILQQFPFSVTLDKVLNNIMNFSFRGVTSNDHRFFENIKEELGLSVPFYVKNVIVYVILYFHFDFYFVESKFLRWILGKKFYFI